MPNDSEAALWQIIPFAIASLEAESVLSEHTPWSTKLGKTAGCDLKMRPPQVDRKRPETSRMAVRHLWCRGSITGPWGWEVWQPSELNKVDTATPATTGEFFFESPFRQPISAIADPLKSITSIASLSTSLQQPFLRWQAFFAKRGQSSCGTTKLPDQYTSLQLSEPFEMPVDPGQPDR